MSSRFDNSIDTWPFEAHTESDIVEQNQLKLLIIASQINRSCFSLASSDIVHGFFGFQKSETQQTKRPLEEN